MVILIVLLLVFACVYIHKAGYLSEILHNLAVLALRLLPTAFIPSYQPKHPQSVHCMGISFRNRLGLAAGWDKQAQCLRGLQKLGFGFVEIGGVTPKSQPGNPRPRVFRLSKHKAIINRYGLNSHGVDKIAERLKNFKRKGMVIGANLAPNTSTPVEFWLNDYVYSLERLYTLVDYFTINVSCPNTGHAEFQQSLDILENLMQGIQKAAQSLGGDKPLLIKISADMNDLSVLKLQELVIEHGFSGLVAVNTSTDHSAVSDHRWGNEKGGLSGQPLYPKTRHTIELLQPNKHSLTTIAVGGIANHQQVTELVAQGADLIQIYTSFAYFGPRIIQYLL